jgi:phosphatidylinositol alpha 1,6-mannosyltransferase
MRVAIVTETFPPDVNGVAHCALRTAEHLLRRGHDPLVVAPAGPHAPEPGQDPCQVVRVPSLPLPGYPQVRVALPGRRTAAAVAGHGTDIVHLASPFVLGVRGLAAATRLCVPAVAVYQTDLAGYARTYLSAGEGTAWRRIRAVHTAAARTLAPSRAAVAALLRQGVPRVHLWPRGVDPARFHPGHRDDALRRELAPRGELTVGYVGRLAAEKRVELLAESARCPGSGWSSSETGPARPDCAAPCPARSSSAAGPVTTSPVSTSRP